MKRLILSIALATFTAIGVTCAGPGSSPATSHIPSAATDPAANTSVVEQSAADVSLPQPEVPPSQAEPDGAAVLPPNAVALLKPAPVYRVVRPAPTRQYSSCGPGGCAPSGPIRRLFGRR